jgi:hypothetical protein
MTSDSLRAQPGTSSSIELQLQFYQPHEFCFRGPLRAMSDSALLAKIDETCLDGRQRSNESYSNSAPKRFINSSFDLSGPVKMFPPSNRSNSMESTFSSMGTASPQCTESPIALMPDVMATRKEVSLRLCRCGAREPRTKKCLRTASKTAESNGPTSISCEERTTSQKCLSPDHRPPDRAARAQRREGGSLAKAESTPRRKSFSAQHFPGDNSAGRHRPMEAIYVRAVRVSGTNDRLRVIGAHNVLYLALII